MSVTSYQIPDGARVLVFTCEDCGSPAHFSIGAHVMDALRTKDQSKAGRWYCGYRDGRPVCIHTKEAGDGKEEGRA